MSTKKGFQTIMNGCQAIIDNPSLSVKDTLKAKQKSDGMWVTAAPSLLGAGIIASSVGTISFSALMAPAIWVFGPFPMIIVLLKKLFGKKRNERLEKERMYQEVIRKQQAAINKQQQILEELDLRRREAEAKNKANEARIKDLENKIKNLEDLVSILSQMEAA